MTGRPRAAREGLDYSSIASIALRDGQSFRVWPRKHHPSRRLAAKHHSGIGMCVRRRRCMTISSRG